MSQKSTKHSNQLKNLKSKLVEAEGERDRWQRDYYSKSNELDKAKAKIEAYERAETLLSETMSQHYRREIERLIDIIRWHIKPDTAVIRKEKNFPPSRHF